MDQVSDQRRCSQFQLRTADIESLVLVAGDRGVLAANGTLNGRGTATLQRRLNGRNELIPVRDRELPLVTIEGFAGAENGDFEDAYIKSAMMKAATRTILLATADKLGKTAAHLIGAVPAESTIVTETPDPGFAERLREAGITLINAG